jgi:hypothetical protein
MTASLPLGQIALTTRIYLLLRKGQLELEIQQQFGSRGDGRVELSPVGRKDDASVGVEVVVQRSPFDWEQQEFQEWFALAERFGVVDDFYWEGGQYWVALGDRVWPYVEMLGVFTVSWLRSAFLHGEDCSKC